MRGMGGWWWLGVAGMLAGCVPDVKCGPLMFDREQRRCVCPEDAPYDPEAGGCVLADGGVIPYEPVGDAGVRDSSVDGCVPSAETCNGADDDCDGDADEAAATAACANVPGATRRACTAGECVVIECAAGRDDCDDEFETGCEAELASDEANCGSCGRGCGAGEVCEAADCEELPRVEWLRALPVPDSSSTLWDFDIGEDGAICVAGTFSGTFQFVSREYRSAGGSDIFVASLNRAGAVQWIARAGGPLHDAATAVVSIPEGGCVLAGQLLAGRATVGAREDTYELTTASFFIARFAGYNASAIALTRDAHIHSLAAWGGTVFSAVRSSLATSLEGVPIPPGDSLMTFASEDLVPSLVRSVPANEIAVTPSQVLIAGQFHEELTIGGRRFVPEPGGDVLVTTWTHAGDLVSAVQTGRESYDLVLAIDVDDGGVVRVAGSSYSAGDAEAVVWVLAPGANAAEVHVIAPTSAGANIDSIASRGGRVYLMGHFTRRLQLGSSTFDPAGGADVFVAEFTPEMEVVWSRRFGSTDNDFARVATDVDGLVVAGRAGAAFSVGEESIAVSGDDSAFVFSARVD